MKQVKTIKMKTLIKRIATPITKQYNLKIIKNLYMALECSQ